jgi:hypothetical protein
MQYRVRGEKQMPKTVQLSVSQHISVLSLLRWVSFIAVTEEGKGHRMSPQNAGFLRDNTTVLGRTTKRTPYTYSCTIYYLNTASSLTVECQDNQDKQNTVNWLKCVGKRSWCTPS